MDRRTFLAVVGSTTTVPAFAVQKKETIKLVSSLPRTGSATGMTNHIVNGIQLAIADFEEKIAGFVIKYTDLDDATVAQGQWDAGKEADNAREAAENKDVMAYIGPYNSGAAKVSMPILNDARIVMVSPACTWPGLTRKIKSDDKSREPAIYRPSGTINFCRVVPHDDSQGTLTARFVADEVKAKKVYILDDGELYGKMTAEGFAEECKSLKVKVLSHESINLRDRDYMALMAEVKKAEPDTVYFGGTSQSKGGQITRDFAASGIKCPLVVPDGCYEKAFIDDVGGRTFDTLTCYATLGGLDPAQLKGSGAEFVKRYKKKFVKDPEAYAVYGYEAAAVVLAAIKAIGKKDREAIRKAVLATKDFDKGVLGKWSFDANGDTTLQQITVSKVDKGEFVPVKVVALGEK